MTCAEYREDLMEAARGGAGPGAVAHARECAQCARVLENQIKLTQGLAALASMEHRGPSPALEAALLRDLKSHELRLAPWKRHWKTAAVFIGGVAAGLVLMLALRPHAKVPPAVGVLHVVEPPVIERPGVERQVLEQQVVKAEPPRRLTAPPIKAVPVAGSQRRPRRPALNTAASPQAPESAPADFIPVPFSAPLGTNERAQLVRVSIPAATLAVWGFPLAPIEPSRKIDADVVVGENGLARAVRLVR